MRAKAVSAASSHQAKSPLPPLPSRSRGGPELAIEIEFDQLWEISEEERIAAMGNTVGGNSIKWDLEEEDRLAMATERDRCFQTE